MIHAPWDPELRDGRLYGRGSADMKGGVAAMCAAAVHALDAGLAGEIVITAVMDEGWISVVRDVTAEHELAHAQKLAREQEIGRASCRERV